MTEHWRSEKSERHNGIVKSEDKNANLLKPDFASNSIVDIMNRNGVRDLSLGSKHLKYLPEEFGTCLKNLVSLDLQNNEIETLPRSLGSLFRLETLILNNNHLTSLPDAVSELRSLRSLEVAENYLKCLPDDLGNLQFLETLNLSSNLLNDLPESCSKLNGLKILNLSTNAFRTLPNCIVKGALSLETLDASNNSTMDVATAPYGRKLKKFYIKNLGYEVKFPVWILRGKAPDLRVLICDGTQFKFFKFPQSCPSLNLRILSFRDCGVNDKFVNQLTGLAHDLQCLRLDNDLSTNRGNKFWTMPIKNLKRPKVVTEICLRGTGIHKICEEIENFVYLVKLDLSDNNIYRLPNEICILSRLEILLLDNNNLSSFPDMIGDLTSLRELKANKNHIAALPESIKDLKKLLYLDLYDNEFQEIPEQLIHIESLIGVDIDRNEFVYDEFSIRDRRYEALRKTLRDRYEIAEGSRPTGPRYESDIDELSNSDKSSMSCDDRDTMWEFDKNITTVEENWDISDNSADEFDPTCEPSRTPKQKIPSFLDVLSRRFSFCPADLHCSSVRDQIMLKKQEGEIKDEFEVKEGQFDDA